MFDKETVHQMWNEIIPPVHYCDSRVRDDFQVLYQMLMFFVFCSGKSYKYASIQFSVKYLFVLLGGRNVICIWFIEYFWTKSSTDCFRVECFQAPFCSLVEGMGTQWAGMGCHLMQLPDFRESILRSDEALKGTGLVVSRLLMEANDATFEDTVHAFVGLAAIQVQ